MIKSFVWSGYVEFIMCMFFECFLVVIEIVNFGKKLIVLCFKFCVCSLLCCYIIIDVGIVMYIVFIEL